MSSQTLSQTYDLSRAEIIERLHQRVEAGNRTKLTRDELGVLTTIFKDTLVEMAHRRTDTRSAIKQHCQAEIELLEQAYPQASVNSYYLPRYSKVIREAAKAGEIPLTDQNSYEQEWTKRNTGESGTERRHHALDFLVYDPHTQIVLRGETTKSNNVRQDNMKTVELDPYIEEIRLLLQSEDTTELIIGIAGATGRRHTEVVSVGKFFKLKHPYLLRFSGQQKKADAVEYDILTLLPAEQVLVAINQLRKQPEMIAIAGLSADNPDVKRVNSQVNRAAHRLLGKTGLVPVLEGFKSVSIHRLRGLYGAIAVHYFCPEHQREHRFLQHYLGHIIDGEIEPNSRATDHYFHYVLTRDGNPLRARGVKIPNVGLLPAMQKDSPPDSSANLPAAADSAAAARDRPTPDPVPTAIAPSHEPAPAPAPAPAIASPMTTEDDTMLNQALVETLQRIAEQQSHTIETQARTVAQLNERVHLLERQLEQTPAVAEASDPATVKKLETTIQSALQQQQQFRQQAEAYRTKWLQTLDSLNQIRGAMNMPLLLAEEEDLSTTAQPAPPTSKKESSKKESSVPSAKPQSTPKPQVTPEKPDEDSPYQRAARIWKLTQQWNREHPEHAMLLNQSILNTRGIHRDAAVSFLTDHNDEITAENQRIGVTAKNRRTFNRGKIDEFAAFLDRHNL